jgi:Kdo2-lipid IVA lauroyltransferase/acyltransferase
MDRIKSAVVQKKSWLQSRAEYAVACVLVWILRVCPLSASHAIARGGTRLLDTIVPRLRRVGLINLLFAFPELDSKRHNEIIDGVFRSLARMLVAVARFPCLNRANISEWISYEGLDNYLEAKRDGRGVLIATAHLGNWELSAFAHALMTEPINVMVRPLDNPFIDRLVEERRMLSGNCLIYKRDAARAVLKALDKSEAVGILVDQNTSVSEGVFVNFFGKFACAGAAFVKFAHRSNAAVIPGFALWNENARRYVLRFYPRIRMTGDIERDTQRIQYTIEQIIRESPDQWMWIHRRWRTRPPGEPPLY